MTQYNPNMIKAYGTPIDFSNGPIDATKKQNGISWIAIVDGKIGIDVTDPEALRLIQARYARGEVNNINVYSLHTDDLPDCIIGRALKSEATPTPGGIE